METVQDRIRRAQPLLGTFVEIEAGGLPQQDSEAAIEQAFAAVADVHRLMSFHDPESDISRLNRHARRRPTTVDAMTYQVLETAVELNRRSKGLFDITTAPALQRMGLLPGSTRQKLMRRTQHESIQLLPDRQIVFGSSDIRIDLGGIAKGFAVDLAVAVLQDCDVPSGLVNAGGDLRVFGADPHVIHVRDPRDFRRPLGYVGLCDVSLASSGAHRHSLHWESGAATAIIDPISQRPAAQILGATVRAHSCMIADALTKVVMLAGEQSSEILEYYGGSAIFVGTEGDISISADWSEIFRLAA